MTVRVRRLLATGESFSTRTGHCAADPNSPLLIEKKKTNTRPEQAEAKKKSIRPRPPPTPSHRGDLSGREVVGRGGEVTAAQRVGLRPPAGQSGVGRRGKPHGANDGPHVLPLLVVLRQLPVEGDGVGCELAQVFGAAVPERVERERERQDMKDELRFR